MAVDTSRANTESMLADDLEAIEGDLTRIIELENSAFIERYRYLGDINLTFRGPGRFWTFFVGKTDHAVMTIISQGLTTKRNKTLWANLPYVFDEAEATVTDTGKTFYQMSYTDQKAIIDGIVMKLIGEQEEAIPEPLRLGTEPDQDEVDRDSMNTPTDDGQGTQDPVPQDRQ